MMLDQLIEAACHAEIAFVAVERIEEYSKIKPEVNWSAQNE